VTGESESEGEEWREGFATKKRKKREKRKSGEWVERRVAGSE
jgi:hypothetical protein